MRLEPEVGESEKRARASEAWAPPEVGPTLPWPVSVEKTRGPPPFPTLCGPPLIRIRLGLGGGGREGGGVELPHTPPCGPQFGVRRIKLFRVGGKEAIGPGSSRCGAERDEPPILHAWACVPSPFPASLSALLINLPSSSPLQLLGYIFCCCPYLPVVHPVVLGTPNNYDVIWEAGHGGPHRVHYALRDVTRAQGYLFPLLIMGTGIPNFLRLFTLWAVPKLLCKLMSQIGDCSFSTNLEM